jgi:hypothetical protein
VSCFLFMLSIAMLHVTRQALHDVENDSRLSMKLSCSCQVLVRHIALSLI